MGAARDSAVDARAWLEALGAGAASAHATAEWSKAVARTDVVFADYSDLFFPPEGGRSQQQGGMSVHPDGLSPGELERTAALLAEAVEAHLAVAVSARDRAALLETLAVLAPPRQPQGWGNLGRCLLSAAATLASLPMARELAPGVSRREWLGAVAQAGRYLERGAADAAGVTLDQRIRDRVLVATGEGPIVVIGHSLGSVVAVEALHQRRDPVELLVTIGSPLGMRAAVQPLIRPQPPATPGCVRRWVNFWDVDDFLAVRPVLENDFCPNGEGVRPQSVRVDAPGLFVHPSDRYLRQPIVAWSVLEGLDPPARGAASRPTTARPEA